MNPTHPPTRLLPLLAAGLALLPSLRAAAPWYDQPQPRFASSDLGRVFSGTIELHESSQKPTLKALAIRVGDSFDPGRSATILYDTELLRPSGAIPDRHVMFNTFRDGLGGSGHWVGPPYLFTTRQEPGWAREKDFTDPRPSRNGPLPPSHARYHGFFRHGPRTVLSYSVGPARILELPWIESSETNSVITRTLNIQSSGPPAPLHFKAFDKPADSTEIVSADDQSWIMVRNHDQTRVTAAAVLGSPPSQPSIQLLDNERVIVSVPLTITPVRIKLLIWTGPASDSDAFHLLLKQSPPPQSLQALTEPGPAQWTQPISTRGQLGPDDDAYTVDTLTPPYENPYQALMTFGGHDFFSNGDAAICTIHGDVWRVSGIDDTLETLTWHRYATGLFQPLGLKIVQDRVYVLGRDQITALHDHNNDHQADYYANFNNQCEIGTDVHEFATSLETDPQGNFYYIKGSNGGQSRHDGSLLRISPDGQQLTVHATGFRWPNGGGAGPDGTLTVADQQGNWVPASRLDVIRPGGFYGYMPAHHRDPAPTTYDGPLCWIPHNIDNSSGGQTWVSGGKWGPVEGQMIHLSYGKCAPFLVLEQTVGQTRQAGVVPLGLKFDSGAMRARFRPHDGQLYVSGLKGWQTSATRDGCFQRVRHTGKPLRIPTGLSVHSNGLLITFPVAHDRSLTADPESWAVEQWNYRWTQDYGSKDYKLSNPEETGHDPLPIENVIVTRDGKSVFLKIPGLTPVMQMHIQYNLGVVGGKPLRGSIHNTIHQLAPAWEPDTPP